MSRSCLPLFVACALACGASVCTRPGSNGTVEADVPNFSVDRAAAKSALEVFTEAPHPFGSEQQKKLSTYFEKAARDAGASFATVQDFEADTPNPLVLDEPDSPRPLIVSKKGKNVIAGLSTESDTCWIVYGSHYDSKIIPGLDYVGANDGGSSSILLVEMIKHLARTQHEDRGTCGFLFVWFDGEEAILDDWNTGETVHPAKLQDNTYGSRHFVSQLGSCQGQQRCYKEKPVEAFILLDMVGMPDLKISQESNSSPALRTSLVTAAKDLGYERHITPRLRAIEDDHIPFLEAQIPSINLIGFEDLSVWHRDGDFLAAISLDSVEIAGKLALLVGLRASATAKAP